MVGKRSTERIFDSRVKRVLEELDMKYEIDDYGDFRVFFGMGEDRTQEAFICSSTSKYGSFEIREIYSWGYTSKSEDKSIPAEVANRLLENSWELKLGAWAKVGDSAAFVSKIDANADSQSLYDALKITLTTADEMEHELMGREDVF